MKIQSLCKLLGENACCAFTALWVMDITSPATQVLVCSEEIGNGLTDDCTVLWEAFFKNVSGKKIKIEFVKINSLDDLKKYGNKKIPVKFTYNGKSHWVGVQNGKVVYNSLDYSSCVANGKPTDARIITFC